MKILVMLAALFMVTAAFAVPVIVPVTDNTVEGSPWASETWSEYIYNNVGYFSGTYAAGVAAADSLTFFFRPGADNSDLWIELVVSPDTWTFNEDSGAVIQMGDSVLVKFRDGFTCNKDSVGPAGYGTAITAYLLNRTVTTATTAALYRTPAMKSGGAGTTVWSSYVPANGEPFYVGSFDLPWRLDELAADSIGYALSVKNLDDSTAVTVSARFLWRDY